MSDSSGFESIDEVNPLGSMIAMDGFEVTAGYAVTNDYVTRSVGVTVHGMVAEDVGETAVPRRTSVKFVMRQEDAVTFAHRVIEAAEADLTQP